MYPILGVLLILLIFEAYNFSLTHHYRERLTDVYDLIQVKQEYHLILQELNSAVITFKDDQIKYFNQAGEDLVRKKMSMFGDSSLRQNCVSLVDKVKSMVKGEISPEQKKA